MTEYIYHFTPNTDIDVREISDAELGWVVNISKKRKDDYETIGQKTNRLTARELLETHFPEELI